ncbi:hypothetical protein F4703DRAFT_1797157 [Phycomyces blakesleeanus]
MLSYPIQLALQTLCLASAFLCALLFAAISSLPVLSVLSMGISSYQMRIIHKDGEGCLQSFCTSSEVFSSGPLRSGSHGETLGPMSCPAISSEIKGAGDVEGLSRSTSINQQNSVCHWMNSTVHEDDKRSHMDRVAYIPVRHENQGSKRLVRTRLPYYGEALEEQMFEVPVSKANPLEPIGLAPEPSKGDTQGESHISGYDKVCVGAPATECSLVLPCPFEQGTFNRHRPSHPLTDELPSSGQDMILSEISDLASLFEFMSIKDDSEDLSASQNQFASAAQQVGAVGAEMASAMEYCWHSEDTAWFEEIPQCPALVGGFFAFVQEEPMDLVSISDAHLEQMMTDADEEDLDCSMSTISESESSEMPDVEYDGVVVAGVSTACWYNIHGELAMVPEDLCGDSPMDLAVEVVPGIEGNLDHYRDDCLMYWDESLVPKGSPIMMATMFPDSGVAGSFPLNQANMTNKGATCVPQQVAEDLVWSPEEEPRVPSSPLLPGSDSGADLPGQSGMSLPEVEAPEPTTIPGVVVWLTTAPKSPVEVLEEEGEEDDDDDDEEDSDEGYEDDDEGVTLQDSALADLLADGGSDPLVLKKFLVDFSCLCFWMLFSDIQNPCIWTLFVSVADRFLQAFDCRVFEICLPVFLATVCSNLAAVYPDFVCLCFWLLFASIWLLCIQTLSAWISGCCYQALDYNISGLHLSAVLSVALSVVPVAVLVVVLVVVLKNMTTAYIWGLPMFVSSCC